jgi:NADH dehydrogenase FAD-containing subunit
MRHRIVIVGGFDGLQAALKLAAEPDEITLVAQRDFHRSSRSFTKWRSEHCRRGGLLAERRQRG